MFISSRHTGTTLAGQTTRLGRSVIGRAARSESTWSVFPKPISSARRPWQSTSHRWCIHSTPRRWYGRRIAGTSGGEEGAARTFWRQASISGESVSLRRESLKSENTRYWRSAAPPSCVSSMLRRQELYDSHFSAESATMPRLGRMTGWPPRLRSAETSLSVSIRSPARKIHRRLSPASPTARSATASISTLRVPFRRFAALSSSSTANTRFHRGSVTLRKFGISTRDSIR